MINADQALLDVRSGQGIYGMTRKEETPRYTPSFYESSRKVQTEVLPAMNKTLDKWKSHLNGCAETLKEIKTDSEEMPSHLQRIADALEKKSGKDARKRFEESVKISIEINAREQ